MVCVQYLVREELWLVYVASAAARLLDELNTCICNFGVVC